jgi:uncharacterized protein
VTHGPSRPLPLALTAFGGRQGNLLVLFTDAPSRVTTYGANRALAVEAPDGQGRLLVDVNRAAKQ